MKLDLAEQSRLFVGIQFIVFYFDKSFFSDNKLYNLD